jgi:WD40 repeat protein
VVLWNVASGLPLAALAAHNGSVLDLHLSHNGKTLVSVGKDNTIAVWDVSTGQLRWRLRDGPEEVNTVKLSPGGELLAAAGWVPGSKKAANRLGKVQLWNLATGKVAHTLGGWKGASPCLAFSPDGKLLATGASDETVRLWETASGKLLQTWENCKGGITSLAFAPAGQLLAVGSFDGNIGLLDVDNGKVCATFDESVTLTGASAGRAMVSALGFTSDGQTLISIRYAFVVGSVRTIKLWDVAKLLQKQPGKP